jgi:hypothetical protein
MTLLTAKTLADHLGVTSQTVRNHAIRCSIEPVGVQYLFTEDEATRIAESVRTAKPGRPTERERQERNR